MLCSKGAERDAKQLDEDRQSLWEHHWPPTVVEAPRGTWRMLRYVTCIPDPQVLLGQVEREEACPCPQL